MKEKRFGCDICGYRNFTKRHLRLHMQTHLSQRKFKCPECDSRFMMPSIVRNHIKSVHRKNETLPRFQCQFKDCLKWFRLNHVLTEHVKRVHLKRAEFGESFLFVSFRIQKLIFKTSQFVTFQAAVKVSSTRKHIRLILRGTESRPYLVIVAINCFLLSRK